MNDRLPHFNRMRRLMRLTQAMSQALPGKKTKGRNLRWTSMYFELIRTRGVLAAPSPN